MSMTDEIKKVVAEGVEDESVTEEEISEVADEVVEEEVEVAEAEEELAEKVAKEEDEDDEDEEEVDESSEEDDEDDEDEVEEVAIPKTKAGVINAALEMLKKARKDEAQQLFAKMVKVSESEDEGGMVAKGSKVTSKQPEPKAKAEDVDFGEDLDLIVAEEATLSDGFRDKASAIFEAAYKSKVSAEIDRLESEYAQNLESEVNDLNESLVNKVDSYLNYVVENWIKENEVAIEQGLRT